jgi:hypothetical protein
MKAQGATKKEQLLNVMKRGFQIKKNRRTNKSRSTSGLAWTAFSRGFICPVFRLVVF